MAYIKSRYYLLRLIQRTGLDRYLNLWHSLNYQGKTIRMPVICGVGAEEFLEGDAAVDEYWMQPILDAFIRETPGTFLSAPDSPDRCGNLRRCCAPRATTY